MFIFGYSIVSIYMFMIGYGIFFFFVYDEVLYVYVWLQYCQCL